MKGIPEHFAFVLNPELLGETKYLEYLFIADNAMTSRHTRLIAPNPNGISLAEQKLYRIPKVTISHRKTPMVADFFFLPGTNLYQDPKVRDALIPGGLIDTHNAQVTFFTAVQKVFANANTGNSESQVAYLLLHHAAEVGGRVAFIRAHGFISQTTDMLSITSDPNSVSDEVNLSTVIKDITKSGEYALVLVDACNPDSALIDTTGVNIPVIIPMTKSGISPERRAEQHEFKVYLPAA